MLERYSERLAEITRPSKYGVRVRILGEAAVAPHDVCAFNRLRRAKQHCLRRFVPAYNVGAEMDSVASVNVEVSRRSEHHAIARCLTVVGVRGRIAPIAHVGFRLDDTNDERPKREVAADKVASNYHR